MIVLDTNVISEPLKPAPTPAVIRWLDAQDPQALFITSVSLAELLSGLEIMPGGRRRIALRQALRLQIEQLFESRILGFDQRAAEAFAATFAGAQAAGNRVSFADCAIAAIAIANGCTVATRNIGDFKGTGVGLVDPWRV